MAGLLDALNQGPVETEFDQSSPPPNFQSVSQPRPDLPLEQPESQPQSSVYDLIKQNLTRQYMSNQPKAASGGPVRQLLQNFVTGAGHFLFGDRQRIQRDRALQQLMTVQNAESQDTYRQALADQMEMVDVPLPDGTTGQLPKKFLGQWQAAQANIASRERIAKEQLESREGIAADQLANKEEKTPNEIELIRRSLAGDPEATAALSKLQQNRLQLAQERGIGYAKGRALYTPFETVVPGTNVPTTISNMQALASGAPRVPIAAQGKLGGQYALYNDAYGILDNIDRLTDRVNLDKPGVSSRVAAGYAAIKDPATNGLAPEVLSNILARQPINNQLSPDERELVLTMAQGKAAGTGLRSILGQAGTNEMQQRLDSALFPGGTAAGSNQSVKQQTAATRKLLDRFAVGQPQVGLNAPGTSTALANRSAPGTTMIVTKPFRTAAGKVYNTGDRITVPATQLPKLKGYVTSAR